MAVPCKLFETNTLQAVQTLVCQMPADANMEHAEAFLKGEAIYGRVFAYALRGGEYDDAAYMIMTLPKPIRFEQARCSLLKRLSTFACGVIHVEKITPLTRRLQRHFGWGDVRATPESARAAWEKGDTDELAAIIPPPPGGQEMAFHVACRSAQAAPQPVYWQHSELRLPFYVTDYTHWSDDRKLEWMRQESDALDLQAFARKWMELFSEKVRGTVPQKAACIKLYARYVPEGAEDRAWKKECDIPPSQRRLFQKVWGQDQDLCDECGKAAAPGKEHPVLRLGAHFCSDKCASLGQIIVCAKCGNSVSAGHPHCLDCRWGLPASRPSRKRSRLDDAIAENEENLARFSLITRCNSRQDPTHEPAWKQRRRS